MMTEEDFQNLLQGIEAIINELDVNSGNVRVALEIFTNETFVEFDLDNFTMKEDMIQYLSGMSRRFGSADIGKRHNVAIKMPF